ncbi:MobB [Desulforapulum autotrophicum HRM2]|uniref:MobB n=1 Tax=Desulforapulum autotrophicum (strain ATCC 43914 / DSM 3382 / VKM B-1955 / HRM2) TaxID=177437 RepID=C0QHN6_DESAH|nr:molybdopterin-guanine dinucleotide biosynthesis protein B [Desulforapulum autotrophicum]ACN13594.1 MobB [Desulforapulum autotrophicum HRM2]
MRPLTIAIVGKSRSGKTTLLEKIIPILKSRGHKIGVVKHAHRGFDMDKTGKDSWRHKKAGAASTLVVSDKAIALVKDIEAPSLKDVVHYLSDMDLIIVEGFKHERIPKIEIFRTAGGHENPLFIEDPNLVAFITDASLRPPVPTFDINDAEAVALFIETTFIHDQPQH